MAKRFTDSKKWKDEWFRMLPLKARLAWIYLCDECEFYGVWKSDFGLASYQLGYQVTQKILTEWFGDRLYFFDTDKVLIVKFFEFQFAGCKDTWNAKIQAREKLEALGFTFENGKVVNPNAIQKGTVQDSHPTFLIKDKDNIKVNKGGVGENFPEHFETFWKEYPRKEGKAAAFKQFQKFVQESEYGLVAQAAKNYAKEKAGKEVEFIRLPKTFLTDRFWFEKTKPLEQKRAANQSFNHNAYLAEVEREKQLIGQITPEVQAAGIAKLTELFKTKKETA